MLISFKAKIDYSPYKNNNSGNCKHTAPQKLFTNQRLLDGYKWMLKYSSKKRNDFTNRYKVKILDNNQEKKRCNRLKQ